MWRNTVTEFCPYNEIWRIDDSIVAKNEFPLPVRLKVYTPTAEVNS